MKKIKKVLKFIHVTACKLFLIEMNDMTNARI